MTKKELIKLIKFTAGETSEPTWLNNEDAISILDDFLNTLKKMELQYIDKVLKIADKNGWSFCYGKWRKEGFRSKSTHNLFTKILTKKDLG